MRPESLPVQFTVDELICCGHLWLPAASPSVQVPAVVLANGFSGTQDWIVPEFAARFAEAGLAALVFDYRHLGRSAGEPRQLVDPSKQRSDLRAALAYARTHPRVDARRVALWGTSLGGSHVVEVAADDGDVAAVVCNMPALDALRGVDVKAKLARANLSAGKAVLVTLRLLGAAVIDALRDALGMAPRYLAVYGRPGEAFFADPDLSGRFSAVAAGSPTWQNRVAARFLLHAPRYRKGTLERVRAPILFSLASRDVEVSPAFIKTLAAGLPHCRVMEYDACHFDLYHGDVFERVVADQAAFLVESPAGGRLPMSA
jgi:dienelactone hydrolase